MKKILIVLFIVFLFVAASAKGLDNISEKIKQNPILAHFLSLEEILYNEEYNRDFTPTDPPEGVVRQTSEFEQMEGVLVVYPLGIPYNLVEELSQYTKVYTIVTSNYQSQCENNYQSHNVNMDNCEFINAPTNTFWVRDFGPWFVAVDNEIAIVDFPYNRPRPNDDEIPIEVAGYFDLDVYGMDLEHTGGNYMCDGNFIGASTDLLLTENPNLTIDDIDQLVFDYLGIESYHLLDDPLDEYIEHIDCWGKFLDVDKVLIGEVPQSDYRYDDFEFVADYFADQISAWGNNYEVYRIYTPGGYTATPYTNSLIVNNKVFVPQSGSQWDDEAMATYEEVMPGYEVIGIYSSGWYDTDALHCRTRGVADRNMLYIQHTPILQEVETGVDIEIIAQIIPYSTQALYADSILIEYKVDEGEFISIQLISVGDDNFAASIPAQNSGSTISYYIHAADESGNSANHPYIGSADPHVFTVSNSANLIVNPSTFDIEMNIDETQIEYLELSNSGGEELAFIIALEDPVNWLFLDPVSGNLTSGESVEIELTLDTNGMSSGVYATNIIISDDREETNIPVTLTIATTNSGNGIIPTKTEFVGNFPNPFNPETTLKYNLQNFAKVELDIYNIRGQLVKTLVNSQQSAGTYQINWNGIDQKGNAVSSGIYYSIFKAKNEIEDIREVNKMILLK